MLLLCFSSPREKVHVPPAPYVVIKSLLILLYLSFESIIYKRKALLQVIRSRKSYQRHPEAGRGSNFDENLTFFFVSGSTKGFGALYIGKPLIVERKNSSHGANNNMPSPSLPLRPVLPRRCIYCSLSAGKPTCVCNKIRGRTEALGLKSTRVLR